MPLALTNAGREAASTLTVMDGLPADRRAGDALDPACLRGPHDDGSAVGTGVRRPGHHRNG